MEFCQENDDGTFFRRVQFSDVEWDSTHLCPACALTPDEAKLFRVVPFILTASPAPLRWKEWRDAAPEKIDGVWTQQWQAHDLPLTLAEKAADIKRLADDLARKKRDMIVAGISPAEMASWPIKRDEARFYMAGGNPDAAPSLMLEARTRGILIDDLCQKVLAKAAQLAALEAGIAGRCGAIQDAAAAAQSDAELLAIDLEAGWPV